MPYPENFDGQACDARFGQSLTDNNPEDTAELEDCIRIAASLQERLEARGDVNRIDILGLEDLRSELRGLIEQRRGW